MLSVLAQTINLLEFASNFASLTLLPVSRTQAIASCPYKTHALQHKIRSKLAL